MGGSTSSKGFWVDPVRTLATDAVGKKATTFLMPIDPLTQKAQEKTSDWLNKSEREAEAEVKRQDEIMKKLALGENPFLGTEDEGL